MTSKRDWRAFFRRIRHAAILRLRATFAVATARPRSCARLKRNNARKILVICYGNIYRSPFVAELLKARLGGSVEVRSAGFHAVAGRPSPERHVRIAQDYGVRLEHHRSSIASPDDLAWADLIVLMDRHNWAALRQMGAPEDKLVWLGAFTRGPVEIPDPYNQDEEEARRIVGRLRDAAELLASRITNRPTSLADAALTRDL
ncbi:MAG TPA: low molecular weight phosphatase family protein [Steroidobacter sp.]